MRNAKYALLAGADVLALCADVDGLFAEPAPPARARYELRGCEPRGPLARAVTQAVVEGSAPQGELYVRTADGVSGLRDVRVLGIRGDVVTVEARTPPLCERDGDRDRDRGRRDAVDCANLIRVSPRSPRPPPTPRSRSSAARRAVRSARPWSPARGSSRRP